MSGITKRFPGVVALEDVSLELFGGEVLALMGENGAGKSTLMKILGGAESSDEGRIEVDQTPVVLDGVREAHRLGIALIHQELMLAPNLDIAANIFLGNEAAAGSVGTLRRHALHAAAGALLVRVGLPLAPTTLVSTLTAGQMQMVEIAKALSKNARILVMDEPTSSLTATESEHLFRIIRQLRSDQIGTIYISHRMDEVMKLADRITVLRDGRHVGTLYRAEATPERIVTMMVGRELKNDYFPTRSARPTESSVLVVRDVIVPGTAHAVSFVAARGEILGFAGLVGSGRTELMETIFGVTPALSGSMTVGGRTYAPRRPRDAIDRGVYLAPEDRKRHGLVLPMTVAENISLPSIATLGRAARGRSGSDAPSRKDPQYFSASRQLVRRQPAESRPRQMAVDGPARTHLGRAHAWHRRRGQGGDLPSHCHARRAGDHHPPGQLRHGGNSRDERQGDRHA
jgi:ribose transport system ATP-binding protein